MSELTVNLILATIGLITAVTAYVKAHTAEKQVKKLETKVVNGVVIQREELNKLADD